MKLAIIPARAGSKRIPGKNIRKFNGKPILAYSIEAARKSGLFDLIIVSTDSPRVAEIGREFGADIPFLRPAELADDFIGIDSVLVHALNWMMESNYKPEYFCCIFATAPLIRPEDIIKGYEVIRDQKATTAFPVATFPHPVFRAYRINEDNRLEKIWPEYFGKRTQDLPETYHDAGLFYWGDVEKYLLTPHINSSNTAPIIIPRYLVTDIDTPEDWELAEMMAETIQGRRKPPV